MPPEAPPSSSVTLAPPPCCRARCIASCAFCAACRWSVLPLQAREIVVRSNHAMIHRIDDDGGTLTVQRVLHAARQWPAPKATPETPSTPNRLRQRNHIRTLADPPNPGLMDERRDRGFAGRADDQRPARSRHRHVEKPALLLDTARLVRIAPLLGAEQPHLIPLQALGAVGRQQRHRVAFGLLVLVRLRGHVLGALHARASARCHHRRPRPPALGEPPTPTPTPPPGLENPSHTISSAATLRLSSVCSMSNPSSLSST